LIATEKDFESNSTKSKAATTHNVPVVTLDWLEETESSNVKADETKYLLSSSAAPAPAAAPATAPTSASAPTQANGAKKRAASSDTSPPPTQDAAKSKKRMKIEDAKVGEGSLAKSKKVAVSVDEYCPNSNYGVYIDGDGLIWDASLNQTNASANNNKFYKVQVNISLI
jgi:poly [ADP-ribose] polymerase